MICRPLAMIALISGLPIFWANDDAAKLAKGLRAALDKIAVAKG